MNDIKSWLKDQFGTTTDKVLEALIKSPSAQGYINGAISEILLVDYLKSIGYEVHRIKEKPAGGFNEKKIGYKGDFLINKKGTNIYYVVECKGLKSNSEFRGAQTGNNHIKRLTKEQAFKLLKKYLNVDNRKIYDKGKKLYNTSKSKWEEMNPGMNFPNFDWDINTAGPDNVNLSPYFADSKTLKSFIDLADEDKLSEIAFKKRESLFSILQTHQPSGRIDPETGIDQAAPLKSDFSIMAVDLFLRTGEHRFVFMNPDTISHSPSSPNHLYQNYIIDILIPGIKDDLSIHHPWYDDIDSCIKSTNPRTVLFDASQLDYRE